MQAKREEYLKKLNEIEENICETMKKQECLLNGLEKFLQLPEPSILSIFYLST